METVLRLIKHVANDTEKEELLMEKKRKEILDELKEVFRMIACNDLWFELECDENMIDSCIYQREALYARYRYLLSVARREGIKCMPELLKCVGG